MFDALWDALGLPTARCEEGEPVRPAAAPPPARPSAPVRAPPARPRPRDG